MTNERRLVNEIAKALDTRAWDVLSENTIRLTDSRLELWIGGGQEFLKIWSPTVIYLSERDRALLWPKVLRVIGDETVHQQYWHDQKVKAAIESIVGKAADATCPF